MSLRLWIKAIYNLILKAIKWAYEIKSFDLGSKSTNVIGSESFKSKSIIYGLTELKWQKDVLVSLKSGNWNLQKLKNGKGLSSKTENFSADALGASINYVDWI